MLTITHNHSISFKMSLFQDSAKSPNFEIPVTPVCGREKSKCWI